MKKGGGVKRRTVLCMTQHCQSATKGMESFTLIMSVTPMLGLTKQTTGLTKPASTQASHPCTEAVFQTPVRRKVYNNNKGKEQASHTGGGDTAVLPPHCTKGTKPDTEGAVPSSQFKEVTKNYSEVQFLKSRLQTFGLKFFSKLKRRGEELQRGRTEEDKTID